jgi:hypothetical protein
MMAGSYDNTLTISSSMTNVAQNDILRLTSPDSAHMLPGMDAFDHDLNFEGNNLLYLSLSSCFIFGESGVSANRYCF